MPFGSLWLPVLLTTVATFVACSLAWAVLPHHKNDFQKLPDEEGFRRVVGPIAPGQYHVPWAATREDYKSAAWEAKVAEGPKGLLRIWPRGPIKMTGFLVKQAIYLFVTAFVIGYILRHALHAGDPAMDVFRMATSVALCAHCLALIPESIWFGKPWCATWKSVADGIAYALITGGIFAALWPKG